MWEVAEDLNPARFIAGFRDVATVVEYYKGRPGPEPGYELEVFNAVGDTVDGVTVRESQVGPLRKDEMPCVRQRTSIVA